MGVWAGGRLEPRPLGSMNGDFVIPSMNPGVGIYLDEQGNRYCNEFFGDPTWTGKPAARIKQTKYYTLFDSKLKETCTYSVSGHTCFDPQEANIANVAAQFEQGLGRWRRGRRRGTFVAEDWDTLAQYMGIEGEAKDNMMASIERYNELAAAGVDEDFGKDSRVLFTLDTLPFMGVVAGPDHVGGVMVTVGGLMTGQALQRAGRGHGSHSRIVRGGQLFRSTIRCSLLLPDSGGEHRQRYYFGLYLG